MYKVRFLYHSRNMLLTLDLGHALDVLLSEFGDYLVVEYLPMSAEQRRAGEEAVGLVTAVRTRFQVQHLDGLNSIRREDIEHLIVERGQK